MTNTEDSCSKPGARYKLRGAVNELCTELRRGHTEDTDNRPAVFYIYIYIVFYIYRYRSEGLEPCISGSTD